MPLKDAITQVSELGVQRWWKPGSLSFCHAFMLRQHPIAPKPLLLVWVTSQAARVQRVTQCRLVQPSLQQITFPSQRGWRRQTLQLRWLYHCYQSNYNTEQDLVIFHTTTQKTAFLHKHLWSASTLDAGWFQYGVWGLLLGSVGRIRLGSMAGSSPGRAPLQYQGEIYAFFHKCMFGFINKEKFLVWGLTGWIYMMSLNISLTANIPTTHTQVDQL